MHHVWRRKFLAETFKYFYLLFAPTRVLDPAKVALTTESRPLRRAWD